FSTIAVISAPGHVGALEIARSLFDQAAIGAVAGLIGGFAIVQGLNRLNLPTGLHPLLAIAGAVLIFAIAAVLGGSGFLAAYLAGLIVGNRPVRAYASIISLNDAVTWLAQIVMFLVLGLLVTPHRLVLYAAPALLIALFLIFVARPVAVWICLQAFGFSVREKLFVSWVGLRGAVSIFLAAVPTLAHMPLAYIYFDVAFFVVLISLVLQGWTTKWVAMRLGQILPDSPVLRIANMPRWARAAMVVRNREILEPANAGKLKPGDYAYFLAPAL